MALSITEQWESWLGTGDFIYHDGLYYTFQKGPSMLQEFDCGGIQKATSTDGIHFTKAGPHPFLPGEDCDFFYEPETGFPSVDRDRGKLTDDGRIPIKWLFSKDLKDWEEAEAPFLVTDPSFNPNICPHLFEWNG